jgi:hypothetical protein
MKVTFKHRLADYISGLNSLPYAFSILQYGRFSKPLLLTVHVDTLWSDEGSSDKTLYYYFMVNRISAI